MAMRLRSGQYSASLGSSSGGSAFVSRKRRRSSGGNEVLDLKNNGASSMLDVTVSGALLSGDENGGDGTPPALVGGDRVALLAYVHRYTLTKHQLSGQHEAEQWNGTTFPCFAWIIMSKDDMHDRGFGALGCQKQMRFYDAIVIPPRLSNLTPEQSSGVLEGAKCDESGSHSMPTIICAGVCEEYPAEQLPLEEVSFDRFI